MATPPATQGRRGRGHNENCRDAAGLFLNTPSYAFTLVRFFRDKERRSVLGRIRYIALLVNRRSIRTELAERITHDGYRILEFPTASKALASLTGRELAAIGIDTHVYPGFGATDPLIAELAEMIPSSPFTENLLYWQVGLRTIEYIRGEESVNRETPVVLRFPDLPATPPSSLEDVLTRKGIAADLKGKERIDVLFGASVEEFAEAVSRRLVDAASEPFGAGASATEQAESENEGLLDTIKGLFGP